MDVVTAWIAAKFLWLQGAIASHHLKIFAILFGLYLGPAIIHGLLRAFAKLPPGSKWDMRLRKVMRFTLATDDPAEIERRSEAALKDLTEMLIGEKKPDLRLIVTDLEAPSGDGPRPPDDPSPPAKPAA